MMIAEPVPGTTQGEAKLVVVAHARGHGIGKYSGEDVVITSHALLIVGRKSEAFHPHQ